MASKQNYASHVSSRFSNNFWHLMSLVEPLSQVTLAEAKHHAKMLADFVAEGPEVTAKKRKEKFTLFSDQPEAAARSYDHRP